MEPSSKSRDASRRVETGGPVGSEASLDCLKKCEPGARTDSPNLIEKLQPEDPWGDDDKTSPIDALKNSENATLTESVTPPENVKRRDSRCSIDSRQTVNLVDKTERERRSELLGGVEPTNSIDSE
jgi:hypothetical protein